MLVSSTLPGSFNPEWDALDGRKGRKEHPLSPTFDPLGLGNDLLAWWDPKTLTTGDVSAWEDRKSGAGLIAGGTGTPTFDGEMLVITSTAFLFGPQVWSFAYPVEIWQVVDQTEAAGSANATSFSYGAGPSSVSLVYTPPIGGQSSAIINGQTLFGGDDYHGVHVIRWTFGPNWSAGYLDGRFGQSSSLIPTAPLEPADVFLGANQQGADLWKGRIGDTVVTKGGLSSGEVNAMWDFMMGRAGLQA